MGGKNVRKTVRRAAHRSARRRGARRTGGSLKRTLEPEEPEVLPPPTPPSAFIPPHNIPPFDLENAKRDLDWFYEYSKNQSHNETMSTIMMLKQMYETLYLSNGKKFAPIEQFKMDLESFQRVNFQHNKFHLRIAFQNLITYAIVTNRREHTKALLLFLYYNNGEQVTNKDDGGEYHNTVRFKLITNVLSSIPFLDRNGSVELLLNDMKSVLRRNIHSTAMATAPIRLVSANAAKIPMRYVNEFLTPIYPDLLLELINNIMRFWNRDSTFNPFTGVIYNVFSLMIYMVDPNYSDMIAYLETTSAAQKENYTLSKLTNRALLFLKFLYSQNWNGTVMPGFETDMLAMYKLFLQRVNRSSPYLKSAEFREFLRTQGLLSVPPPSELETNASRLNDVITALLREI